MRCDASQEPSPLPAAAAAAATGEKSLHLKIALSQEDGHAYRSRFAEGLNNKID